MSGTARTMEVPKPRAGRDWRSRASCVDEDSEIFFPVAEAGPSYELQVAEAKSVCRSCPSKGDCLDFALAALPFGIAGGMTADERATYKRRVYRSREATS